MTLKTAKAIAMDITGIDGMRVNSYIQHDTGAWSLAVTDTRTGVQFVVNTPEDWADRRSDAEIDWAGIE